MYSEMAEARISWAEDQFSCAVCLDLLKEPVTIPCGHSYCKGCITNYWDQEDQRGIYRCPHCRQTFSPRPVLGKNVVFAEMVEKLKMMKLQSAPVSAHRHNHTGSRDVHCDTCIGIKKQAVKSCLECRSSYCQNHLEQHESLFRGKAHNLMDATGQLQEMICPRHNKVLEIYCWTDEVCICVLCLLDEHKNHDTVSIAAARQEIQGNIKKHQREIQKHIQREEDLQELREAVESHKHFAQKAVEDSERIFTELICSIEKRHSEVTQRIRDQERAAVSRAEKRLKEIKQAIDNMKRKDTELKQLLETQDHVQFFQCLQSISFCGSTFNPHLSFDDVEKSISQLRDKLMHFFRETIENMNRKVKTVQVIGVPEYQTRQEFLQYFHLLTVDLNSVNYWLHLSEGNTKITTADTDQCYPDHPDRFDWWMEMLCIESMTRCCYWEVEWSGDVDVGVTYKSINRKGNGPECVAGFNNQSWSLFCTPTFCSFYHNNIDTVLPVTHMSRRIGVYVNQRAGILSFYSVSNTMSLIHRVQTTFSQPLYAVFGFGRHSSVKLCHLNV